MRDYNYPYDAKPYLNHAMAILQELIKIIKEIAKIEEKMVAISEAEKKLLKKEKKTYKLYLCSTRSRMHATMVSRSFSSSGDRKFKSASVFKIRLIVSISFSFVIT